MFNRQIEITRENESILFINAVIENLRYGIISLDRMFSGKIFEDYYNIIMMNIPFISFICKAF